MRKYIISIIVLVVFPVILLPAPLSGSEPPVLRVGVASMITPVSAVRYYQQIVDYLSLKMGLDAEMIHRTTYDEIDLMLEEKKLEVAFICSAPYVLDQKRFGVELLVAPVVNGKPYYRSDIIVHRQNDISTFGELRGKSFAFVDPKSNSGKLYPVYWLTRRNLSPDDFFKKYLYSYSHNKSVEMVAKKKVDGAAVDSIVYGYMLATDSPYARVRVEDTEDRNDVVNILSVKKQGQDLRYRGEEFQAGDLLLQKRTKISAPQIALLASVGVTKVKVFKPCEVAVLVTGSELVAAGEEIADHQIRDSNMIMLKSAIRESGGEVSHCLRISDEGQATRTAIGKAKADIILCTGGVSVGRHDHVKEAAKANGFAPLFWRIMTLIKNRYRR